MRLRAVPATAAPLTCSPLHAQLELGLREKQRSSLLMLPTMVDVLPQGQETGEYYSIDFGGTNLRLLYTRLGAAKHAVVTPWLQRAP
jgi:hexokinase